MTEKYCVSLELAQRMERLGFKQDSDFYWDIEGDICSRFYRDDEKYPEKFYSAYHVGELGDMLPNLTQTWRDDYVFVCWLGAHDGMEGDTEADAQAKMLIYLAENSLIDPTKV